MKFLPYGQARSVPNIIVDGAATTGTVLTLSHWPRSGTPAGLRADTSTAIVFRYLDTPSFHVNAEAVSNNHFDEDGLLGIYALLNPIEAEADRGLILDAASAGDFGVFATRDGARLAFAIASYADPGSSPLPADIFRRPYPESTGELYTALLGVLPDLIRNLQRYRRLWEREDQSLTDSEALIDRGVVTLEERPDIDLAIVRIPDTVDVHSSALHNRTFRNRLLLLKGNHPELRYRYESWVQLASRRPLPRVDLEALATELTAEEQAGARWVFDGVDDITPSLHLEGTASTTIPPDALVARVEQHLRTAPPAWDPYA